MQSKIIIFKRRELALGKNFKLFCWVLLINVTVLLLNMLMNKVIVCERGHFFYPSLHTVHFLSKYLIINISQWSKVINEQIWVFFSLDRGVGVNKAVTKLSFGHITTKTWAYSGVFGFSEKSFGKKNLPPPRPQIHFLKIN